MVCMDINENSGLNFNMFEIFVGIRVHAKEAIDKNVFMNHIKIKYFSLFQNGEA